MFGPEYNFANGPQRTAQHTRLKNGNDGGRGSINLASALVKGQVADTAEMQQLKSTVTAFMGRFG